LAAAAALIYEKIQPRSNLDVRLGKVVAVSNETEVSCPNIAKQRPLVLLALGQSNAANHGALVPAASGPVLVFARGKCVLANDPLPGGTGLGGSIWRRLPQLLADAGVTRPVLLAVLAVDASTLAEWTEDASPLKLRLTQTVEAMKRQGLPPTLVLWQQGEADARAGTTKTDYAAGLDKLEATLREEGSDAPIVLARSTVCRAEKSLAIRSAIEGKTASSARFRPGPDTDDLTGELLRFDGCHFTARGLDAAARMWQTGLLANKLVAQ
jgi:hypothetical protein